MDHSGFGHAKNHCLVSLTLCNQSAIFCQVTTVERLYGVQRNMRIILRRRTFLSGLKKSDQQTKKIKKLSVSCLEQCFSKAGPGTSNISITGDLELCIISHPKYTIQQVWGWDNLCFISLLGDFHADSGKPLV